jgi:predicted 3-demethylubiquinone-9 3-methyltransferase (glyoxalase superfamily)
MVAKNTICLWYDGDAEEAARFYAYLRRVLSRIR